MKTNINGVLKSIKQRLSEYRLGVIEYNEKEVRRLQRAKQAILKQLETEYHPGEWV